MVTTYVTYLNHFIMCPFTVHTRFKELASPRFKIEGYMFLQDHHGHSGKDPLAGMTREEVDAVLQVQQMTGIADISIAAKAMHVFSQMDPVMIQTIGMLGPDTIQELTSGNPDALKRIPNYEEIVDGILKGKINPHKMQDTMQK